MPLANDIWVHIRLYLMKNNDYQIFNLYFSLFWKSKYGKEIYFEDNFFKTKKFNFFALFLVEDPLSISSII